MLRNRKNLDGGIVAIFIYFVLFFTVLVGVVIAGAYFYYQKESTKTLKFPAPQEGESTYTFKIDKGMTVDEIGSKFTSEKIIPNPYILKAYLYINPDKVIQAGVYRVPNANVNLGALVELMQKGSFTRKLTLPTGWRLEQYKEYLVKEMGQEFADKFVKSTYTKEGYMYPDTYIVDLDVKPEDFARQVRETFDSKVKSQLNLTNNKYNLTENEVVILASILQREENDAEDMKKVTGVLTNRIKSGWPLQVDATIQYMIGKTGNWWPVVKGVDTDRTPENPFNSYHNKGLPPSPICNPSFAAIDAVINSVDSDYYFYLADNDGITHFAKTVEEHNANVQNYLR